MTNRSKKLKTIAVEFLINLVASFIVIGGLAAFAFFTLCFIFWQVPHVGWAELRFVTGAVFIVAVYQTATR